MTMVEETAEFAGKSFLAPRAQFEIGGFRFDPAQRRLTSDSGVRELEPKVSELLVLLIEAEGVVRRDDILDALWGVEGSDEALTQTVSKLRRAFGDTERPYQIIETAPRVGYRLIAPGIPYEAGGLETSAANNALSFQQVLDACAGHIRKRASFYKGVAFGGGAAFFVVAATVLIRGPQNIEQEFDCADHWTAEECASVIRAVID